MKKAGIISYCNLELAWFLLYFPDRAIYGLLHPDDIMPFVKLIANLWEMSHLNIAPLFMHGNARFVRNSDTSQKA